MGSTITIGKNRIGPHEKVFVIAEISGNHNQDYNQAIELISAAKDAGADAVKLQTYTPDTLTINCSNKYFTIKKGTIWGGKNLYALYREAYTPWEWQPKLKKIANKLGLYLFSTPFDFTSVDFLEKMNVPAYKLASFEIVDIPLIRRIAQTGKPVILSTGMASLCEIEEAVTTLRNEGNNNIALLKCTSAYPALPEEMNLRTIPHLEQAFNVPAGLSDHTLGIAIPVAAVALGATIIEKHLTISRTITGPDSAFSLEPCEFRAMVDAVRQTEKSLGQVKYEVSKNEKSSRLFRKSLFVIKDIKTGEKFSAENIRSIRPGYGLLPKNMDYIMGRKASMDISRGTPLIWEMIG